MDEVNAFFGEVAEVLNSDVELKDLEFKSDPFKNRHDHQAGARRASGSPAKATRIF